MEMETKEMMQQFMEAVKRKGKDDIINAEFEAKDK